MLKLGIQITVRAYTEHAKSRARGREERGQINGDQFTITPSK